MRRYTYTRMTPDDLSADLNALDLSARQLCRITGAREDRVLKWLDGREDIPPWLPVVTGLMKLPGGVERAREVAEFYLQQEDSP